MANQSIKTGHITVTGGGGVNITQSSMSGTSTQSITTHKHLITVVHSGSPVVIIDTKKQTIKVGDHEPEQLTNNPFAGEVAEQNQSDKFTQIEFAPDTVFVINGDNRQIKVIQNKIRIFFYQY